MQTFVEEPPIKFKVLSSLLLDLGDAVWLEVYNVLDKNCYHLHPNGLPDRLAIICCPGNNTILKDIQAIVDDILKLPGIRRRVE